MDLVGTVSFHVNGAEGSGRADILTFAASDTALLVNSGHLHCPSVRRGMLYHLDGIRRAMLGARAAMVAVGNRDTVLLKPYGVTDMNEGFIFLFDSLDGACRACLRAMRTFGTAVAALERHLRLHEAHRVG